MTPDKPQLGTQHTSTCNYLNTGYQLCYGCLSCMEIAAKKIANWQPLSPPSTPLKELRERVNALYISLDRLIKLRAEWEAAEKVLAQLENAL